MKQEFPTKWLKQTLEKGFDEKFDVQEACNWIETNPNLVEQYAQDLHQAVSLFNSLFILSGDNDLPPEVGYCINSIHTAGHVSENGLQNYYKIINELREDSELQVRVVDNLTNNTYFTEVYQLQPISHVVANLMILFYRTAMLESNPQYKKDRVQFSSTIEEMTILRKYNGEDPLLLEAIQHWLEDWEDEGFDKRLVDLLQI